MRGTRWMTAATAAICALSLASCERPAEDRTAETAVRTDAGKSDAVERLAAGPTLAAIKRRGRMSCGVHEGLVGFAYTHNSGRWRGFDVDFCRAVAAAIFNDPTKVKIVPLDANQRAVATTYLAQIAKGKYFAKPIVVPIETYKTFYRAEASHQDFMKRNPTNGYIVRWDAPKVAALKRFFPTMIRATPAP